MFKKISHGHCGGELYIICLITRALRAWTLELDPLNSHQNPTLLFASVSGHQFSDL